MNRAFSIRKLTLPGWLSPRGERHDEFLPGALEIQERPPSQTGRAVVWLLLLFFSIALAWAFIGEVDIVVTAPGEVVPAGYVKTVQAPETGRIDAIHVAEGDRVVAGQRLLSLDPTFVGADTERLEGELAELGAELRWREALEHWLVAFSAEGDFSPSVAVDRAGDDATPEGLLARYQRHFTLTIGAFDNDLLANRAEQAVIDAELARTNASLAVLGERLGAFKSLVDSQYGSRVQYLELLQQHTGLEKSLPLLRSKKERLVNVAAALVDRRDAAANDIRLQNLSAIEEIRHAMGSLQQEVYKARQRRHRLEVLAPVAGTVQELTVHTLGGVVNAAQMLMKVVPSDDSVRVEALVQNRDIGFLLEGQSVAVKVDAFNFTRYGLLDASVVSISRDAVEHPTYGAVFHILLELHGDTLVATSRSPRVWQSPRRSRRAVDAWSNLCCHR